MLIKQLPNTCFHCARQIVKYKTPNGEGWELSRRPVGSPTEYDRTVCPMSPIGGHVPTRPEID